MLRVVGDVLEKAVKSSCGGLGLEFRKDDIVSNYLEKLFGPSWDY